MRPSQPLWKPQPNTEKRQPPTNGLQSPRFSSADLLVIVLSHIRGSVRQAFCAHCLMQSEACFTYTSLSLRSGYRHDAHDNLLASAGRAWPIAQSNTNIKYSRKTSYLPTLLLELRECLSEVHSQVTLDVQRATLKAVRTKCESADTVTGIS